MFSKMGQHRQALEIYVFKLQDPEKAEEYVSYFQPSHFPFSDIESKQAKLN